jgi:hypothetical protein
MQVRRAFQRVSTSRGQRKTKGKFLGIAVAGIENEAIAII